MATSWMPHDALETQTKTPYFRKARQANASGSAGSLRERTPLAGGQANVLGFPSGGISIECGDQRVTRQLAEALSATLERGDVVLLDGDLAAGKTSFVAMVCDALGAFDQPSSPTYVISNVYLCPRFEIFHIDAYRLSGIDEFLELGLDEFFSEVVTFIEWGDRVRNAFDSYLRIEIDFHDVGADSRIYRFTSVGSRWKRFVASLAMHAQRSHNST